LLVSEVKISLVRSVW